MATTHNERSYHMHSTGRHMPLKDGPFDFFLGGGGGVEEFVCATFIFLTGQCFLFTVKSVQEIFFSNPPPQPPQPPPPPQKSARHPTRWRPEFQSQSPDRQHVFQCKEIVIQNLFPLLATTVFRGATDLKSFFQSWESVKADT